MKPPLRGAASKIFRQYVQICFVLTLKSTSIYNLIKEVDTIIQEVRKDPNHTTNFKRGLSRSSTRKIISFHIILSTFGILIITNLYPKFTLP